MSAIPGRRRRRTITAAVMGVIGLLALPGGIAYGVNSLLNSTSGNSVDSSELIRVPATPAALLVGIDDTDSVTMIAMIALRPGGKGGTIVSIPVGAKAETTKNGLIHRIADTYKTAGLKAFVNDVSGLVNVSFSATALMTKTQLAELLAPVGQRQIALEAPVIEATAAGGSQQVLTGGTQTLDGAAMAAALLAAQPGQPESSRWSTQKSVWQSIAAVGGNVGDSSGATQTSGVPSSSTAVDGSSTSVASNSEPSDGEVPTDVPGFFSALMAGPAQYWQLSGTLVTEPQNNPLRTDMYDLDGGEVLVVMATVAPSAVTPANSSLSFLIDTPYADAEIVRQAALRIAYIGGNVLIVRHIGGTAGPKTIVRFDEPSVQDEMSSFTTLFGPLEFVQATERVEGINAHVILGDDFKAFIGSDEGSVIATTTSSTIAD